MDLRRALAATTAAGVALGGLVDCMMAQPKQPITPTSLMGGM
jgi:hypothetical protein